MVDRRVMEKDAATRTGLRIKAARTLTNLNQESFADRFKFSYPSVKNWELGRSIPRDDTVVKIIDALFECGVQTSRDWLLFGTGSGPNHIAEGFDGPSYQDLPKAEIADFSQEIAQFERVCVKNNMRPLVAVVSDDLMRPFFFKGDILGAESFELKALGSKSDLFFEYPYLVEISPNMFQPRMLSYNQSGSLKFWRTHQEGIVGEIKHPIVGKITWVRRSSKTPSANGNS